MIGLDIGSYYVKLCSVEKRGAGVIVSLALMTRNTLSPLGGKHDHEVAAIIAKLARKAGLIDSNTAFSAGSGGVTARNFEFPKMTKEELKGAVQFEAAQASTLKTGDMYSDFVVLTNDAPKQDDVLYVAAPKNEIESRMHAVRKAGLKPAVCDIGNLAIANCFWAFDSNPAKESVVMVDIGHSTSNISIIDNDELRFIRTIECGGREITREISHHLGVSTDLAETIKRKPEVWPSLGLNMTNILKKSLPDMLEGVYRSVEYCMSRKKLPFVDQVLVTGGSSSLQGIDNFITESRGFMNK
jgi:type IV pilus assembly protein PilM